MQFSKIDDAINEFKDGKLVILVDDKDRENEGDLVLSAEKVTPEKLTFMIRHSSGLLCVPIIAGRLHELDIPMMVEKNTDTFITPFTVSVDSKKVRTGASAHDKAITIKTLIDKKTRASDIVKPGHVFPLRARENGILERKGHTEAAIELCKLAGLYPAAVITEIMNDNGSMAQLPELIEFSRKFNLMIVTIDDLLEHINKKNSH